MKASITTGGVCYTAKECWMVQTCRHEHVQKRLHEHIMLELAAMALKKYRRTNDGKDYHQQALKERPAGILCGAAVICGWRTRFRASI